MNRRLITPFIITSTLVVLAGCAEGPFWRTGYLSPWVRQQWAQENSVAPTLFAQRKQLRKLAEDARQADPTHQERVSQRLAEIVRNESVVLLRLEATALLAEFRTETATEALQLASRDPEVDVRLQAASAWGKRGDEVALQVLSSMVAGDSDIDVRLRATRALGNFSDPEAAKALYTSLTDPSPALQVCATESLASVTGENFGTDIKMWRDFLDNTFGQQTPTARRSDSVGGFQ